MGLSATIHLPTTLEPPRVYARLVADMHFNPVEDDRLFAMIAQDPDLPLTHLPVRYLAQETPPEVRPNIPEQANAPEVVVTEGGKETRLVFETSEASFLDRPGFFDDEQSKIPTKSTPLMLESKRSSDEPKSS